MDTTNLPSGRSPLVALAGNIGSGKTTFATRLGDYFRWWVGHESLDDNPFLEDFYCNMGRWSFHVEMCFLGNRYRLHTEAASQHRGAVLDRSVYEDRYTFVEASLAQGILSQREYDAYVNVFDAVVPNLREPDLFIVVSAPVHVLKDRITRRGRPFEMNIPIAYLEQLQRHYELWAGTISPERLVEVDSHTYNFATNPLTSPEMAPLVNAISRALSMPNCDNGPAASDM